MSLHLFQGQVSAAIFITVCAWVDYADTKYYAKIKHVHNIAFIHYLVWQVEMDPKEAERIFDLMDTTNKG